jgi:hypothetical protein
LPSMEALLLRAWLDCSVIAYSISSLVNISMMPTARRRDHAGCNFFKLLCSFPQQCLMWKLKVSVVMQVHDVHQLTKIFILSIVVNGSCLPLLSIFHMSHEYHHSKIWSLWS